MMKYYSADYVLPVSAPPIRRGIVAIDEVGEVHNVFNENSKETEDKDIERYEGIIVPGFVNSHCHLELSYLHNKIPQKSGLIPFIKEVIKSRKNVSEEVISKTMQEADRQMFENGIVAVGDIVNTAASREVKLNSKIYYHTFIELLCFEPERAKEVFRKGNELLEELKPLRASLVPHAAYSVCKELLRFINKFCGDSGEPLSIHNQETEEENKLYRYKTGQFLDFYQSLNINTDFFKPQARNSLQSIVPMLGKQQKILLVHNIYTSMKDIYFVRRSGKDIFWCFCPNANLYIENRLPKVEMFQFNDSNITLGTDSLASNSSLCILSELKTLHQYFPQLSFTDTISWATLNGARFFNIDDRFGSIEAGKTPGLNLITHMNGLNITPDSKVRKLI